MRKLLFTFLLCLILTASVLSQPFAPDQKPPLGIQIDRGHLLSYGLVGFWLFNEGSGTKVFDLSGNGNDGTSVGGPAWFPGKFGSALKLDGTDDLIDFPTITSISGPFTLCCWVNVPNIAWDSQYQWSFAKDDAGETYIRKSYTQSAGGPTTHKLIVRIAWGTVITLLSDGNCTPNVWEHIAITRDSSDTWRMYINAVEQASTGVAAGVLDVSTYHQFGKDEDTAIHLFAGKADNMSMYSRAFSPSEIAQLYREPFCMFKPSWNWMLYGGISVPTVGGQVIWINMK